MKYPLISAQLEMICPLQHEDEDFRFGAARIEETIILRICPKCGIVFVPSVNGGDDKSNESDIATKEKVGAKPDKQILKWP